MLQTGSMLEEGDDSSNHSMQPDIPTATDGLQNFSFEQCSTA